MAIPNTFTNGTIADADEVNENFEAIDPTNEKYDDDDGTTISVSGTHTFLTLTVGGGYTGLRPVFFNAKLYSAGNLGYDVAIKREGRIVRNARSGTYSEWSAANGAYTYPNAVIWVASGDTITVVLTHLGGATANVTLSEIKCWCPDADLTLT